MKKPRSVRIAILNPTEGGQTSTSVERARSDEQRKRAVFVTATSIRYLEEADVRQRRAEESAKWNDDSFWKMVAQERGGHSVSVVWKGRSRPPLVEGGPRFATMQARLIVNA